MQFEATEIQQTGKLAAYAEATSFIEGSLLFE
jgi:hypothetical protein